MYRTNRCGDTFIEFKTFNENTEKLFEEFVIK